MNIGQASSASGVSAKMIRYDESIGLIPPSARRDLGFSMDQIRDLLRLWSDRGRSSAEVKAIALEHVAELEERARELNEMADALKHLAAACGGNERPDCPIIKGLEGQIPIALPGRRRQALSQPAVRRRASR